MPLSGCLRCFEVLCVAVHTAAISLDSHRDMPNKQKTNTQESVALAVGPKATFNHVGRPPLAQIDVERQFEAHALAQNLLVTSLTGNCTTSVLNITGSGGRLVGYSPPTNTIFYEDSGGVATFNGGRTLHAGRRSIGHLQATHVDPLSGQIYRLLDDLGDPLSGLRMFSEVQCLNTELQPTSSAKLERQITVSKNWAAFFGIGNMAIPNDNNQWHIVSLGCTGNLRVHNIGGDQNPWTINTCRGPQFGLLETGHVPDGPGRTFSAVYPCTTGMCRKALPTGLETTIMDHNFDGGICSFVVDLQHGLWHLQPFASSGTSYVYSCEASLQRSSSHHVLKSVHPGTAVACQWNNWGPWQECNCQAGLRKRLRSVAVPALHGGPKCKGPWVEEENCTLSSCRPHSSKRALASAGGECSWEPWGPWGTCSKSCGGGVRWRSRFPQSNNTAACLGISSEAHPCNKASCLKPLTCKWSAWLAWTPCSKSCDHGVSSRTRILDEASDVMAEKCMASGQSTENKTCFRQACPQDCELDQWGAWSSCSRSCGSGFSHRTRIPKVLEQFGGKGCEEHRVEEIGCHLRPCPRNCQWSFWGDWQSCSVTCGGGNRTRKRVQTVLPEDGGAQCNGSAEETQPCRKSNCPFDCQYEDWGDWSDCSTSCGQGTRSRARGYANASNGGHPCVEEAVDSSPCVQSDPMCPSSGALEPVADAPMPSKAASSVEGVIKLNTATPSVFATNVGRSTLRDAVSTISKQDVEHIFIKETTISQSSVVSHFIIDVPSHTLESKVAQSIQESLSTLNLTQVTSAINDAMYQSSLKGTASATEFQAFALEARKLKTGIRRSISNTANKSSATSVESTAATSHNTKDAKADAYHIEAFGRALLSEQSATKGLVRKEGARRAVWPNDVSLLEGSVRAARAMQKNLLFNGILERLDLNNSHAMSLQLLLSKKCLETAAAGPYFSAVQMWACDPSKAGMAWMHSSRTGQVMNLIGMCLEVQGSQVHAAACTPDAHQQKWSYQNGNGMMRLQGKDVLCLTTPEGFLNGGQVTVESCDPDSAHQRWVFMEHHAKEASLVESHATSVKARMWLVILAAMFTRSAF